MPINMTVQSYKRLHCFTALCSSLKRAHIFQRHISKLRELNRAVFQPQTCSNLAISHWESCRGKCLAQTRYFALSTVFIAAISHLGSCRGTQVVLSCAVIM